MLSRAEIAEGASMPPVAFAESQTIEVFKTAEQLVKWLEDCNTHFVRGYTYCGNCVANDRSDRKHEKCRAKEWLEAGGERPESTLAR
jgi:hypothetical protein